MKLWLVRHAQPLVEAGVCYGASDVAADRAATQDAAQRLAEALPTGIRVMASTLQRCERLAYFLRGLRPDLAYMLEPRLQEMNFGQWELQRWDAIPRAELDGWTADFDSWRCGGAESVDDFMRRMAAVWDVTRATQQPAVWITHAGVIRGATLLAQGVRRIHRADQWPAAAPAWGQWQLAEI